MSLCELCPRKCRVDREKTLGFCSLSKTIRVAKACLHPFEEPSISGKNGAGTVFFSGCNLNCVYCQNSKISKRLFGKEISPKRLREIFFMLIEKGAHNIELVTPTHFSDIIKEALSPKLPVPVIYNCGGYEDVEALKNLEGLIDIYMPDMKYGIDSVSSKYSKVSDYPLKNLLALNEMYRQVGDCVFSDDGLLKKGLLVRHLILPKNPMNTKKVISEFSKFSKDKKILFSLMAQYTPCSDCDLDPFPELKNPLSLREYNSAVNYLSRFEHIEGYVQELYSSGEKYIPDFNLSGI